MSIRWADDKKGVIFTDHDPKLWGEFDGPEARRRGWDLFVRDDSKFEIMVLDDREHCKDEDILGDTDDQVTRALAREALAGDRTAALAIYLDGRDADWEMWIPSVLVHPKVRAELQVRDAKPKKKEESMSLTSLELGLLLDLDGDVRDINVVLQRMYLQTKADEIELLRENEQAKAKAVSTGIRQPKRYDRNSIRAARKVIMEIKGELARAYCSAPEHKKWSLAQQYLQDADIFHSPYTPYVKLMSIFWGLA